MADNATDAKTVEELLETAVSDDATEESSTEETVETTETPSADAKAGDKAVPYSRFKEVNEAYKDAKTEFSAKEDTFNEQLATAQKSVAELADVVRSGKDDSDLVAALNALANNPKYVGLIDSVNDALAGIDRAEETGEVTKAEAKELRQEVNTDVTEEIHDELFDQRQELQFQRADLIAKEYMAGLPEEYGQNDKDIISEMWASRLDWDTCMENPDGLPEQLRESLQSTLESYGDPKGKAPTASEEETETASAVTEPSIEEQMGKYLSKDWGALKAAPEGKEYGTPEVSDEDFSRVFGAAFQKLNKRD